MLAAPRNDPESALLHRGAANATLGHKDVAFDNDQIASRLFLVRVDGRRKSTASGGI